MDKKKVAQEIKDYLMMVIAVAINAVSTRLFIAPNSIVAGGITGLALVLNILNEHIPIGTATIAINLPILLLGIRFQGWKLILRCLITIVTFGVITDIFVFLPAMTNDSVLASLYGGVCQGV